MFCDHSNEVLKRIDFPHPCIPNLFYAGNIYTLTMAWKGCIPPNDLTTPSQKNPCKVGPLRLVLYSLCLGIKEIAEHFNEEVRIMSTWLA